jgi:hypothetical protein
MTADCSSCSQFRNDGDHECVCDTPLPVCSLCSLTADECECDNCLGCKKMCLVDDLDDYHCAECHTCEECGAEQCMEWVFNEDTKKDEWVCIHCEEDKEAETDSDTDCEWCETTHKCEDKCVQVK